MSLLKTSLIIDLIDRVSGPIQKIEKGINRLAGTSVRLNDLSKPYKAVKSNLGLVGMEAGKVGAKLALLGAGAGWFIKSQLIDTASQFEQFRTVLETVEGSSEKAQRSMGWVSNFAAKTPYELGEVTDAFVKLRAYGMEPTNGLLRTLGDTASAMGKPLNMAVEAMADAVTGEYERLKEFGIKAQTKGDKTRFEYSDREGKTQYKIANNKNREQIRDTLAVIWNERYAGAMEKMSSTYKGMMSNLADQWTRFKMMIMQNGAFEFIKERLQGILDTVDKMAASGQLKILAQEWGDNLVKAIKASWTALVVFWNVMQGVGKIIKWVTDHVGGFKVLGAALAVMLTGKLIISVVSLGYSLWTLGTVAIPIVVAAIKALTIVMMTNPILALIALIAAAATLIYLNWGPIAEFFKGLWGGIKETFNTAIEWIENKIKKLGGWIKDIMPEWLVKIAFPEKGQVVNGDQKTSPLSIIRTGGAVNSIPNDSQAGPFFRHKTADTSKADVGGWIKDIIPERLVKIAFPEKGQVMNGDQKTSPLPIIRTGGAVNGIPNDSQAGPFFRHKTADTSKADVGGTIKIEIDSTAPVKVRKMENRNKGVNFSVDRGLMMASSH